MPCSSLDSAKLFPAPPWLLHLFSPLKGNLWLRSGEWMAWDVCDHVTGAYACVSLRGFISLIRFLEAFVK